MKQLSFFNMIDPITIRKNIEKEYKRLGGETYEEWNEFIRVETDYRLSQLVSIHPDYSQQNIKEKDLKNFVKIFLTIKFKCII